MIEIGRLSRRPIRSTTGKSIQAGSMLAADLSVPSMVTPGRPIPTGVDVPRPLDFASRLTTRTIEAMTASGVDGVGVGDAESAPTGAGRLSTSTTAALIPLPPTSTPMAIRPLAISDVSSVIDASRSPG